MRIGIFSAVAVIVTACSGPPSQSITTSSEPNIPPADYRGQVIAYLRTYLNDPTGVREAFITEPALRPYERSERYASCLRFNAKNSLGKYEGSRDRFVVFLGGRFDTMTPARNEQCKDANWQPFPELQKLTR